MRKPGRFLIWLGAVFALALLWLCLSARVEKAPQAQVPSPAPPALALQFESAMPFVPEPLAANHPQWNGLRALAPLMLLAAVLTLPSATRDANGRVLRKRRYVKCYYPIFKLNLACG